MADTPPKSTDWDGDPTQNVRELFKAESLRQDGARDALEKLVMSEIRSVRSLVELMVDTAVTFQNAQAAAETRRIDQLSAVMEKFQTIIRDMLAESVRTTSALVADKLREMQSTYNDRVSKLEAGAFTQAGKSSVNDPAMAELMQAVRQMSGTRKEFDGVRAGQDKMIGWGLAAAGVMIAAAVFLSGHVGNAPRQVQADNATLLRDLAAQNSALIAKIKGTP